MVEERADVVLSEAHRSDVAFLVVGDPFGYDMWPLCMWTAFCLQFPTFFFMHILAIQMYVKVGNEKSFLGVLLFTLLIGDLTLNLAESSQIELFQVDM